MFPNSYVNISHNFLALRLYGGNLSPVDFKVSVVAYPDPNLKQKNVGKMAAKGFQLVKTWMITALNETIFVNYDSDLCAIMEDELDNPVMYVPSEPDDAMLAALILSKLRVIAKGCLIIESISLSSSDTDYTERVTKDIPPEQMPTIAYLGGESYYEHPWWERPSLDISDILKDEIENEEEYEELKRLDPLTNAIRTHEEADIITIDSWKKGK